MSRAPLSKVSMKQLVAEIERRRSKLSVLIAQRDALTREIAELQVVAGVPLAAPAPTEAPAKRRGRPPGERGRKPLVEYVKETLAAAAKGLSVAEIEKRILASDYPTKAKRLYKPIAKVLSEGFKKVSRGVYALKTEAAAAVPKLLKKPKSPAKRGKFSETSEQFVLGLVKGKGLKSTDIQKAWTDAGRGGSASPTISGLFKVGKVKREPLKGGGKGFLYTAA